MGKLISILILALVYAGMFFFTPAAADAPLIGAKQCDVPYQIIPLSDDNDPYEAFDEKMMRAWKAFAPIMTWPDNPPQLPHYFLGDGKNQIAGFFTDAEIYALADFHWGGAAAVTMMFIDHNGCLVEADIMFNAELTWTTDIYAYLIANKLPYQHALVHELGHTFGLADYNYKGDDGKSSGYDSVMNYAIPWLAVLGLDDALAIQHLYPAQAKQVHDLGVYSYYCESQYSCPLAGAAPHSVSTGDVLEIHNLQVANLGNFDEDQTQIEFFLYQVEADTAYSLGTVEIQGLNSQTSALIDLEITIGADVPSGTYFLQAQVQAPADDYANNNTAVFPREITVQSTSGNDDETGGNADIVCQGLVEQIYDICGLQLVLSETLDRDAALLVCDISYSPWDCIYNCFINPQADDCSSFQSCLEQACSLQFYQDSSSEDKKEKNSGGCGV